MEKIIKKRIKKARRIMKDKEIDAIVLFNPLSSNENSHSFNYFLDVEDYEPSAIIIKDEEVVLYNSHKRQGIYENRKRKVKGLYDLMVKEGIKKVGVEDIRFSLAVWLNKKGMSIKDIRRELLKLRMIKEREEIEEIRKAGEETRKVFYDLYPYVWGVEEKEVARRIKCYCLEKGSCAFEPIAAAEENSSKVHHLPTNKKIKKHLLLDFGFKNKYCSDFSITLTKINKRKEEWEKLRSIFLEVTDSIYEGISLKEVDELMYNKMKRAFKEKEIYKRHHQLGHGVGIEIHEYPSFSSPISLKKNMVIAIEPAVYKTRWGMRIEDTFIVGKSKIESITKIHHNEF